MPSFAQSLEKTLHNALANAAERSHEYATLEHLLLEEIDGIGIALGKQGDQHIGAGHRVLARRLHVQDGALDYPLETREQRIGDYVIVVLSVGADGRPTACRVQRPSRDAQADAITCRLAQERFRFRPATDASGRAIPAEFGWKQSWHY